MRKTLTQELQELEQTDPAVAEAAANLDATIKRLAAPIHQVYVFATHLDCVKSCGGPAPHIHESRESRGEA